MRHGRAVIIPYHVANRDRKNYLCPLFFSCTLFFLFFSGGFRPEAVQ